MHTYAQYAHVLRAYVFTFLSNIFFLNLDETKSKEMAIFEHCIVIVDQGFTQSKIEQAIIFFKSRKKNLKEQNFEKKDYSL